MIQLENVTFTYNGSEEKGNLKISIFPSGREKSYFSAENPAVERLR